MANYATLKAAIESVVRTNGNNEITGALLQQSLLSIIDSIGSNYQFVGIATPSTNPGTPDQNVFYIAATPGVYSNFDSSTLGSNEICVFKYNGSWTRENITPLYTDRPGLNVVFDELYINGFQQGYLFTHFVWNGSKVTAIIRDSSNNIIWFANGLDATPGEVFQYSQNGVTLYAIFNTSTHLTSPENTAILPKALSLSYNPKILYYISTSRGGAAQYTDRAGLNSIFDELYITGFQTGYYFSFFTWNGTKVTAIIRDSSNNIIWFANGLDATPGEVFEYSQNGVTLYAIFNSNTHTTSPENSAILAKSLNLAENSIISGYVLTPNQFFSPINVSRFDLGANLPNGLYHGSWVALIRRCDEQNDSVFCFANKMASAVSNKFFDFYSVGTRQRGTRFVSEMATYIDYSTKNGLSTSDCLLLPIIVGAVNNADGDNLTEKWFTGGNHAYGNTATGSPTLRELSNTVRVDGVLVPIGRQNVRGRVCTIDVVNNIQGYNTCKENGGGREIIQQRAHIEITNTYIETTIEFVALESVVVYGPFLLAAMNVADMVGYRFVGSQSKRGLYVYDGNGNVPSNDDQQINAIRILTADDYLFDVELDLSFGIGTKLLSNSPNCYVTNSAKAYFTAFASGTQIPLNANDSISYRTRMYFKKK